MCRSIMEWNASAVVTLWESNRVRLRLQNDAVEKNAGTHIKTGYVPCVFSKWEKVSPPPPPPFPFLTNYHNTFHLNTQMKHKNNFDTTTKNFIINIFLLKQRKLHDEVLSRNITPKYKYIPRCWKYYYFLRYASIRFQGFPECGCNVAATHNTHSWLIVHWN